MKNFKQLALGLLVGALAIGFSAFTNAKHVNHKKVDMQWYQYTGTVQDAAHALNPDNYLSPVEGEPCATGATYCAVQADDNSGKPDLGTGTTAKTQINAFFNSSSQGVQISAEDE
jgi:hypothetical protein